jgi:hypothetical protein
VCVLLGIEHRLIKPRQPHINGMVERFNSRISDECLNEHWVTRLKYARVVMARGHPVELWRRGYNDERPKKKPGGLTPAAHVGQPAKEADTVTTELSSQMLLKSRRRRRDDLASDGPLDCSATCLAGSGLNFC